MARPGSPFNRSASIAAAIGIAILGATTLSACSGSTTGTPAASESAAASAVAADPALHDQLPDAIKEAGTIKVGTEALYPPYEYLDTDGTTVIGLDVDLFDAVAARLGVDYTIDNIAFDSLLPALDTGRYDVIVAAMTDNAERQQNYDFIDYFSAGQSIVTLKDNPEGISTFDDLCGKTVSVLKTSAQETLLQDMNKDQCASNPIDILSQQSDNDALLQVQNKRAVADVSQDAVATYTAQTVGGGNVFTVANAEPIEPKPLGYVVKKGDALQQPLQAALQSLIDDGTYQSILAEHGLTASGLDKITINAGE